MTAPAPYAPLVQMVRWGGEMQLVAAADIEAGAVLVAEVPIAFVETRAGEDDLGPWLLLESILTSDETLARVSAADLKMTKWRLGARDLETLNGLARKYRRNPEKLAQLYHRVAANNIRYSQGAMTGYGIWPTLSRSNHSCEPNAQLGSTAQKPLAELLLATRAIPRGEAICWNYLAEDSFLALDWRARNAQLLRHFQFLCRCVRCERERPASFKTLSKSDMTAFFEPSAP